MPASPMIEISFTLNGVAAAQTVTFQPAGFVLPPGLTLTASGGGTGTGAAPVVAEVARSTGAVAIACDATDGASVDALFDRGRERDGLEGRARLAAPLRGEVELVLPEVAGRRHRHGEQDQTAGPADGYLAKARAAEEHRERGPCAQAVGEGSHGIQTSPFGRLRHD